MEQLHKKYNFMLIICLSHLLFCCTNEAATGPSASPKPSHHFVLVHGVGHGAWCWFELVTLLKSSGERVTALDMASAGIDPQEANDLRSVVADYFQPLTDFMTALPSNERVILVGHSYGGVGLAYSMELFPEKIAVAVFVTAFMPGPTLSVTSVNQGAFASLGPVLDSTYTYNNGSNNPPTSLLFGPSLLATKMYQLSPVDDLVLATLLIRWFPLFPDENLSKVIGPTKQRYGMVKRVFIMSGQDKALKVDFQEWMIQRNPPNGVFTVNGSDHMVMLSKPTELQELLLRIARNYS